MTDTPTQLVSAHEPSTDDLVATMISDLSHTGELSMLYRMEIADAVTALRAEVATLRESEARMREALEPFSIMAGEMFARNWNKDGVAISFVGEDGPIRMTFEHFMAARAALQGEPK